MNKKNIQYSKLILPNGNLVAGEAYRNLRTTLTQMALDISLKTLLIISPYHGEGKTSTAINLSLALSDLKYRTLLVESDLRYPDINSRLGLAKSPGLVDILNRNLSLDVVIKNTAKENLKVITSGTLSHHPAETLESRNFASFINETKANFDFTIFDSSPFLLYSDTNVLKSQIDSALLVIESGRTSRDAINQVITEFRYEKLKLLGVLINKYPYSFIERLRMRSCRRRIHSA